jgi:GAF domain-containing protein/CheY-like chemotaxis protein
MQHSHMYVLILDDDELFCTTLAHRLGRNQEPAFSIVTATTVAQARQAVREAAQPFDVFLIDQRLGSEDDGIDVFQELRRRSPETEAIIFTGLDTSDAGLRAYQAGAHRYLAKPFDSRELVWILRSLRQRSVTEYERDWLKILTEVAEEAQRALSVHEIARIVVRGGQRLGFERARLWRLSDEQSVVVCISQAGSEALNGIDNFAMPIAKSVYMQVALGKREPVFFQGQERGEGYMEQQIGRHGFRPPIGEWAVLPLWAGGRCLGALTLDNASHARPLRPEQRRLLRLFGSQVAAALERGRLHALEHRKSQEIEVLNQIARRVAARAPIDDLHTLLLEVHAQVGALIDVPNFMVVLLDEETDQLNFRLHIESSRLRQPHVEPAGTGLVGHVIATNRPLLLPFGGKRYRAEHGVRLFGRQSRCWLGVPLRVGDRPVGAIVAQDYERAQAYGDEDLRLLGAVADLVAGMIQASYLKEREEYSRRQLALLHQASAEIMKLAEESEHSLWHVVLTTATAGYALGFNRALVLLSEESGTRLRGRLGIGHFDPSGARRAWKNDRRTRLDFDRYLQRVRQRRLRPTPIEERVRDWVLDLEPDGGAFAQAMREGRRVIVPQAELQRLPDDFTQQFGRTDYAVLPLRSGSKILGLVVVDNLHTKARLRRSALDHLETLLAQAALVWENIRQRNARDALIDLNHAIMSKLSRRTLHATLTQICEVAKAVMDADAVTIYVLRPGVEPYQFDTANTTAVGEESDLHLTSMPRTGGVTAHILRSGPLVINDIVQERSNYDGQPLAEHPFHRKERLRASIGLPLIDPDTGDPLGVMYLNYRTPHTFTPQDIRQTESFANLASIAIRNAWAAQRTHDDLAAIAAETQAREKELNILRRVLAEALLADTDGQKLLRALLHAAHELLAQPLISVGLLLLDQDSLDGASVTPYGRWQYVLNRDGALLTEKVAGPGRELTRYVGQADRTRDAAEPQAEIDVPIRLGRQVVGVFNVKAPEAGLFDPVRVQPLERLAAAAGLALDNMYRQKHLHNLLAAAQAVVAPTGLQETLNAVLQAARALAPALSALTIWYREPESGRIVLGPYFGVRYELEMARSETMAGDVVWTVTHSAEPIWAACAATEPRLHGESGHFITREAIESVAAFPLRADGELIGAMFFNYRQRHDFTNEERGLFPILAEIAAASVRDAARLEATRNERQRLEAALAISGAVGATLDIDQTLRNVMYVLRSLFPGATPCVLTYSSAERALEFTQASLEFYPIDNPEYKGVKRIPIDGPSIASALASLALANGDVRVMNTGEVEEQDGYLQLNLNTRSELCLTLMSGAELLGVLALESPRPNAFDEHDVKLIRSVGQQVSSALDRAYQNARLRFQTAVAARTAWAAEIAHDINREVGYIRNRAYWLYDDDSLHDEAQQYAREIDASAKRLAGSLGEATAWSAQKPAWVSLDSWLREWAGTIIEERCADIAVRYELGCPNITIPVHQMKLQHVLRHLVRNALEAMGCSGCLTIRTRLLGSTHVQIEVEDTGPGVPLVLQPLLFEQPIAPSEKGGGTGLLLVRSTVEAMSGYVRLVPTRNGTGAIFVVTLPRDQHPASQEG